MLNVWKLWEDIYTLPFDNQMVTFLFYSPQLFTMNYFSVKKKKSTYGEPMLHADFWFL